MFVGLGLSGVVPILHALSIYGFQELDQRLGLSWVILQGALYIFGAFLYAVSRQPPVQVLTC
jgi:adiponectin receptor